MIIVILKVGDDYAGFIHVALRSEYVEGTSSSPVGYIEGIYIYPSFRKRGFGALLVNHAEKWCKHKGCKEMASDTEITNLNSIEWHTHLGFNEANRIVCFVKSIQKD